MIKNEGYLSITKYEYTMLKACTCKDTSRYFMGDIYIDVENGNAVSTDGRRIVIYDIPEGMFPEDTGIWELIKISTKDFRLIRSTTKSEEYAFPQYLRVIPEILSEERRVNIPISETVNFIGKPQDSRLLHFISVETGKCCNYEYLLDMKNLPECVLYTDKDKPNAALQFVFDKGQYIVMPMSID